MIEIPGEFIFVPKATGMLRHGTLAGVFYGSLLFTPEKMYILPSQTISGAGNQVETVTLNIDGQSVTDYVQSHVDAGKKTAELIEYIESWMDRVGMEAELHALEHQKLADFKVKPGFFGGSVMFRSPKDGWRDAFSIKSKHAQSVKDFLKLS